MRDEMRATAQLSPLVHISEGKTIDEAEELRSTDNPNDYKQAILTEGELMGIDLPEREPIIEGLLTVESMMIINGYRGGGKTWFVDTIGNEVSWGGAVGPWKVRKPRNVLLIDGEMPLRLLQERLKMMNVGRNRRKKEKELYLYPESYAYRIGLNRANILDPRWRETVKMMVLELGVELLILDNLSSLAPGIDENDKTPFDAINRWMLELRFLKVSIILTHHTGKSGEQRGTSAHEDHVDTALLLEKPKGYHADEGCKFVVLPTKDRTLMLGGKTTTMHLVKNREGRLEFAATMEKTAEAVVVMMRSNPDMSRTEARKMGISDRTYYRAMKMMAEEEG